MALLEMYTADENPLQCFTGSLLYIHVVFSLIVFVTKIFTIMRNRCLSPDLLGLIYNPQPVTGKK